MSRQVDDPSVGFNGSFESIQQGLPVNWIVYAPDTVPDADFDVLVDSVRVAHGRQSLRFDGPSLQSGTSDSNWRQVEWQYQIPEDMDRLRLELNVLSPGSLWIDDVKVSVTVGGAPQVEGDQ